MEKSKEELISDFKNAAMLRSRIGGSKKGFAALFSKQSSAASSTDSVLASSTAMSLPGVAQPLVGSEVSVAAPQALLCREKNANPASSMNSTVATPNSVRKPASFEPASGAGMALDGKLLQGPAWLAGTARSLRNKSITGSFLLHKGSQFRASHWLKTRTR